MVKQHGTLVLDNGAYDLKAGYSSDAEPRVLPNSIVKCQSDRRRNYVADELSECQYKTKLYYSLPFEYGYLVNWNVELEIWDHVFGKNLFDVKFDDTRLLLTDPSCLVPATKNIADEVAFEIYQFAALNLVSGSYSVYGRDLNYPFLGPTLIALDEKQRNANDCVVVVDSGFSFTHVAPYYKGALIDGAVKRINVGGKALTNQLIEWLSYRQVDLRGETYIINQAKEDICFVTTDINRDMKTASMRGKANTIFCNYVLPDFVNLTRGQIVERMPPSEEMQMIELSVERFTLPELIFHPTNVGIQQAGVVETVLQVLADIKLKHPSINFTSNVNVICAGGNAMFPNFVERMRQDLQPNFFDNELFDVQKSDNPITHAWSSAQNLLNSHNHEIEKGFVTKKEYAEYGSNIFLTKYKRL